MKKIVSLILIFCLTLSVLPAALAADFSCTTEQKQGKHAGVRHIDEEEDYIKQALVDLLDDAMYYFRSPKYYYSGIWQEAQTLYKNEVKRIYACTELEDLVTEGFFGYMANEQTLRVYFQLEALSSLTKHYVTKAGDLNTLKKELLFDVAACIKEYITKADYNAFYWDKIVSYKNDCVEEIKKASTFADYLTAKDNWEFFFEFEELDEEDTSVWEYLEKDVLSKNEMSAMAQLLKDALYEDVDSYEKKGYDVENDAIEETIEAFAATAAKSHYAKQTVKAYEKAKDALAALVGATPEADREYITVSVRKRALNRLREMYYTYDKEKYSTGGWYELEDVYAEAEESIQSAVYKDEIDDKFFEEATHQLKEVKTYAAELKELKASLIEQLKEYLTDEAYNTAKAKPLVIAGAKAINACKDIDKVYEVFDKYFTALEKTIKQYKITVVKVGKGAVSKTKVVTYGENYTVKIIPTAGYKITSIVVDGKKVKLTNAYTFKEVTGAHSIKVTFGK